MSDAPRLKINEVVTAKDVQEELARATGQSEWTELKFWKFFRTGRTEIFDSIFETVDKDLMHPSTFKFAEQEFVKKVKLKWSGPLDEWILKGDWLDNRADIVSWMRASYWRSNKHKWIEKKGGVGFNKPWNVAGADNGESAGERLLGGMSQLDSAEPKAVSHAPATPLEQPDSAGSPRSVPVADSSNKEDRRLWMDVMLQ